MFKLYQYFTHFQYQIRYCVMEKRTSIDIDTGSIISAIISFIKFSLNSRKIKQKRL